MFLLQHSLRQPLRSVSGEDRDPSLGEGCSVIIDFIHQVHCRTALPVRDRNNLELGTIEEWRPVDCVMCTVIALRAGPAAAGPKA
jgi:hypothetical protein